MTSKDVPSIVHLPFEVLEVIINFSSVSSQLLISRVSRLFHLLALRALYHDISLSSPTAVIACCRTLASNNDAASIVRSFEINYTYYSPSSNIFFAAYYSLLKRALLSLVELHTLKLLVHDPYFITLFIRGSFPGLRHFECYLTPSAQLIAFLNQHSKINYLQLSPHEDTTRPLFARDGDGNRIDTLPSLELPGLQCYVGNVQGIAYVGSSTRLRAAIINWNAVDTDPDLAFRALRRSSRHSLTLLSCVRRSWNLDLIHSISVLLPDVHSLHISNIMLVDTFPAEEYLQSVSTCLARFTQLNRLHINCIDYWEMGDLSSSLNQDFSTVTAWGGVCPSLVEISLPHSNGLSWFRIFDMTWIPDPTHALGEQWLRDSLASKRHPKWSLMIRDLEETERTTVEDLADKSAFIDTIIVARRRLSGLLHEMKRENAGSTASASIFTTSDGGNRDQEEGAQHSF